MSYHSLTENSYHKDNTCYKKRKRYAQKKHHFLLGNGEKDLVLKNYFLIKSWRSEALIHSCNLSLRVLNPSSGAAVETTAA